MFRGSIVALVTPMIEDKVDIDSLRALVNFHIEKGSHGLVAAGTTGEAGTLSHAEKLLVIRHVIEEVKERIPVIAGTAMNATKACIELTQEAMALGAHAALIMTPAYIKPTQEGLCQHYKHIAKEVAMPIILYNVPSRTVCDLLPETVAELSAISNIVGIKDATGQMTRLQQLLRLTEGRIDVFSGDDPTAAQWMLAGAKGNISVTANVAPQLMAKMCDLAIDKEQGPCLKLHEQLMLLNKHLFVEVNPIGVKWAVSRLGLMRPDLRLPLVTLSAEYHAPLEQAMRQLELI